MMDEFNGFSKLSRRDRLKKLKQTQFLSSNDADLFEYPKLINPDLAEHFIENVIGYFPLPLGVGVHLCIDHKDYVIPMAVEETSIIASLSKTAKWVKKNGYISTSMVGDNQIIGQIQIASTVNFNKISSIIGENKSQLIKLANEHVAKGLVNRGGGVKNIECRSIARGDGKDMVIIHILADTCDAMGANIITQVCEFLKEPIEALIHEKVSMCILSNLNDRKLTKAEVIIENIEPDLGQKIEEGSLFSQLDPYRAATNNKGVLNGIDPILIATGNDWRAVEASIHAYACRDGQYRSITSWSYDGKYLKGTLIAPIVVGIVGGVTRLHPIAKVCLSMLKIQTANDLSRISAAVGLVQNLGAIKALTTVGLVQGHMKLHISNLSLSAGAKEHEMPIVQKKLEELLSFRKRITLSNAIEILKEIRNTNVIISPQPHEQTA